MSIDHYHVRLALSQYDTHFRAELFTEDLGDTDGFEQTGTGFPVFDLQALRSEMHPESAAQDGQSVGARLFSRIFGVGANHRMWAQIKHRAQVTGRPIRLLIDATSDGVRDLPFGLLRESDPSAYVFRRPPYDEPPVRFVRILRHCRPVPLALQVDPARTVRMLVVAAEPRDMKFDVLNQLQTLLAETPSQFRLCAWDEQAKELVNLREALSQGEPERLLASICRASRSGLAAALKSDRHDILHVLAHGKKGGIYLCDAAGDGTLTSANDFAMTCARGAQLAFLQVCRAGATGHDGAFGGVAQQLLNPAHGDFSAVIASSFPMQAAGSTRAAARFYQRLAAGAAIDEALDPDLTRPEEDWTWAFLELWVRPRALSGTGSRGEFQFTSPYPGLSSFKERDWRIFKGRSRETDALVELVAHEAVVVVVGDSGSGKSSILQAGLMHRVRSGALGAQPWRMLLLRPGARPATALCNALEGGGVTAPSSPSASAVANAISTAVKGVNQLLLILDQFEEMFALGGGSSERDALAEGLAKALEAHSGRLKVVIGIRSDFLYRACLLPPLAAFLDRAWVLRPPNSSSWPEIVAGSARECGYEFEPARSHDANPDRQKALLERLLSDPLLDASRVAKGAQTETTLPLLTFALQQLWLRAVRRGDGLFTHEDYEALDGLDGTVVSHADTTYADLPRELGEGAQQLAEKFLPTLVSPERTKRPRFRADFESESSDSALARRLVDHLVGERLLTTRADPVEPDRVLVEFAHEVLIRDWALLRGWLEGDREREKLRAQIETASQIWVDGGQLAWTSWWADRRLDSADALHTSNPGLLKEIAVSFLRAGLEERRRHEELQASQARTRRRFYVGAAVALIAALLASGWGFVSSKIADEQANLASQRKELSERVRYAAQIKLVEEQIRGANVTQAMQGLANTSDREMAPLRSFEWAYLWKQLHRSYLDIASGRTKADESRVYPTVSAVFGRDVSTVFTGGGENQFRRWNASDGMMAYERDAHRIGSNSGITAMAYSRVADMVATGGDGDNEIKLWDPKAGTVRRAIPLQGIAYRRSVPKWVGFSRDGGRIAALLEPDQRAPGSSMSTMMYIQWKAVTFDSATGKPVFTASDDARCAALSPDGSLMAVGRGRNVNIYELDTGKTKTSISLGRDFAGALAFSRDGSMLAIGGNGISISLVANGSIVTFIDAHADRISSLCFSENGEHLVSSSADRTAKVWSSKSFACLATLVGHQLAVKSVDISPDSRRAATSGADGQTKIWNLDDVTNEWTTNGGELTVSPRGDLVLCWDNFSNDGRVVVNDAVRRSSLLEPLGWNEVALGEAEENPGRAEFSADGSRLLLQGSWGAWRPMLIDTRTLDSVNIAASRSRTTTKEGGFLIFHPAAPTLYDVGADGGVATLDCVSGALISEKENVLPKKTSSVCFLKSGQVLAVPDGQQVRFLEVGSWNRVSDAEAGFQVTSLRAPVSGTQFLAIGSKGEAALWSGTEMKSIMRIEPDEAFEDPERTAFSADGLSLALARRREKSIDVWDLKDRTKRFSLIGHSGMVNSIQYSADARRLVSGDSDGVIKIWDTLTGQELLSLESKTGPVMSVRILPDARAIISSHWQDEYRRIRVWRGASDVEVSVGSLNRAASAALSACSAATITKLASQAGGSQVDGAAASESDPLCRLWTGYRLLAQAHSAAKEGDRSIAARNADLAAGLLGRVAGDADIRGHVMLMARSWARRRARVLYDKVIEASEANPADWHSALKLADKALSIDPECGKAHFMKGQAHYKLGDKVSAVRSWTQLVSMKPVPDLDYGALSKSPANAHYNLACEEALAATIATDPARRESRIESAIKHLELCFSAAPSMRSYVDSDQDFDGIRSDRRLVEILKKGIRN